MNQQAKVLISDDVHQLLIDGLTQAGYSCDYRPAISLKEVLAIIHEYQGIIINSKILVDRTFLDKAVQLKFVARLGSGLEIIDLDYAQEKKILVHRAPDGNCDAVAEHALGMLLAFAINLRRSDAQVRQKNWQREQNRGWELMGKTIGIIGFGYTGQAFAQRLAGFGMKVLAYDKYLSDYTLNMPHVQESSMEAIFDQADILSLHLPATAATQKMVDTAYWEKFRKPLVLVNTSRGNIVCTESLLRALENQKVLGACLDVFENEKPETYTREQNLVFQKLFERENVLLSPHIAGWTKESKERLAKLLLDRIKNQ